VMDIPLREIISQEVNERFMNDLSMLQDESPAHELIDEITCPLTKAGRRFRALDPTGKDRELLQLIGDPAFRISGLTNKMLRQDLLDTRFGSGRTDKQLSAKISQHLRLLRAHGIIRKLPKQNRYQLTLKGYCHHQRNFSSSPENRLYFSAMVYLLRSRTGKHRDE